MDRAFNGGTLGETVDVSDTPVGGGSPSPKGNFTLEVEPSPGQEFFFQPTSVSGAAGCTPPVGSCDPCDQARMGRKIRHGNRAQRRAVAARDGGCAFPGCDKPIHWCDLHHDEAA